MQISRVVILISFSFLLYCCASQIPNFSEWELVVSKQNFPEGITWNKNGNLYSSNCHGNWITRISESSIDTFLTASDSTFGKTNGMISLKDGSILACDYGIGAIIKFELDGSREIIIEGYNGERFNRPNDLTPDQYGNFYFTDPKSYDKEKPDGRIFYHDFSAGKTSLVQSELTFPNGIGISPTNKKLYVCESAQERILSFSINNDGSIENKEVFINLPGGDPDGIDFDEKGNLYVAHFGGEAIIIISSNGEVIGKIKTPGKKPSNLEFANKDKKTLYITEDETNSIYKCTVSIPGFSSIGF